MPTSATPKQFFDRVLYNELKVLTKPKVDPARAHREKAALQRKSRSYEKSAYPPWHKTLAENEAKGPRSGFAGNPRRQSSEELHREMRYELARDARLNGGMKGDSPSTVDGTTSDGKITAKGSASSWDAIVEEATGKSRKGAKGVQQSRGGGKKGAHTAMSSAFSDSGSMATDSASSWDALMQATGDSKKGAKGYSGKQGQKRTNNRDAAAGGPKAAWEMAYAPEGSPKGNSGKRKRRSRKSRKGKGGDKKGGDATGGFDWDRFYS